MKHESADIVALGGGMASLSLVTALLLRGYRGKIIILEQSISFKILEIFESIRSKLMKVIISDSAKP